jgi:hypothetical protein
MTMTNADLHRCAFALLVAGVLSVAGVSPAASEVSGKFIGNGKPGALKYAVVVPREPWKDQPAYTVILSAKDPASSRNPEHSAAAGELGDALVIAVSQKGEVFNIEVCHQSLTNRDFSTNSGLEGENVKIDGKILSGRFFTKSVQAFFDNKWEVDVTVKAAVPAAKK